MTFELGVLQRLATATTFYIKASRRRNGSALATLFVDVLALTSNSFHLHCSYRHPAITTPTMDISLSPVPSVNIDTTSACASLKSCPSITMDAPASPIQSKPEESMINWDGPPSSPFVTEVVESHSPSRQSKYAAIEAELDTWARQPAPTDVQSPTKNDITIDLIADLEDKENIPQSEKAMQAMFKSPLKMRSPVAQPPVKHDIPLEGPFMQRRDSVDSIAMPPPSARKLQNQTTPKKVSSKTLRSAATTPLPLSRGNSFERPSQTSSSFQAGLDARAAPQDLTSIDDTCFSTFSEIPEMTLFAKLGEDRSPSKTPRTSRKRLSTSRSPSPTPRRQKTPATHSDGTTSFLIDFTQQIEGVSGASRRQTSPSKSQTEPNLLAYINNQRSPAKSSRQSYATPSKPNSILNLLDFELPPAPTPRSVPTITVRELESLKSSYLSQISSLKATLSGREAEVDSLKKAVGDAERRVGETQEQMREERSRREHAEHEKAEWEKRGTEVERVLHSVKEEVMRGEAEKEDVIRRFEESERRVEDAEARAAKAEERLADALAARADSGDSSAVAVEEQVQRLVQAQIDQKIETVSRELHAVYKEKHERKVGTLKKSYEARSEKKCADLQARLEELSRQNEDLLAAKDATFSGALRDLTTGDSELKTQLEEQKAQLAGLQHEMQTSRAQQAQLMHELEKERIEKGDLVAAVDEMLLLQAENGPAQGAMSVVEDFRKSISRPSGLKPPSGIGRGGMPSGLNRSTSGGKSRMLANIERMGRTGGGTVGSIE